MKKALQFLQELEKHIPPPSGCHHVLMANQYGSDAEGWVDKLGLQVNKDGTFYPFVFGVNDMNRDATDLANDVVSLMTIAPIANWQVSDTAGKVGKVPTDERCGANKAPSGWWCSRTIDHDGSCAAHRKGEFEL